MRICAWFILAWLTGAVAEEVIVDADGTTFNEDESAESLISYASSAYKAQHLSRAVELWRRVLKLTPNDENVLLDMGETLLKIGNKPEALEAFKTTIKLNPLNNFAYYDAAEAASNPSEQIGFMKKLVEIEPRAAQEGITGNLGALLLNANRYDEAVGVIQKLVDSGGHKMKDHINLADAFYRMGNVQGSTNTLLDALAGDSDKVDKDWRVNTYAQLSNQLHILDQKGEAVHFAKKAVKLDPSGPKNWLRLATAQDDHETMEDASQSFANAVLTADDVLKELDKKYDQGFDSENSGKANRAEYQNLLQALAARKSAARETSRQTEPVSVSPPAAVSDKAEIAAEIAAIKMEISQENYERAGELKNLKVQLTQAELSQKELPLYLQNDQSGGWKGRAAAAWATGSGRCNIPSRDIANLTRQEFYENYVDKGQPVILFGEKVFGGVATSEWAEEKFRQTWSQQDVRVVSSNMVVNDQQLGESSQQMALQDYMDSVMGRSGDDEVDNPLYLFKQNQFPNITKYIEQPPFFTGPEAETRFTWSQFKRDESSLFFLGPTHSGTYFHAHSNTWNAVVYGRKRWFLFPPQVYYGPQHKMLDMRKWLDEYYPSKASKLMECVQEAGTVFFVPDGWNHATVNLDDTIGIAVEVGPSTAM